MLQHSPNIIFSLKPEDKYQRPEVSCKALVLFDIVQFSFKNKWSPQNTAIVQHAILLLSNMHVYTLAAPLHIKMCSLSLFLSLSHTYMHARTYTLLFKWNYIG